MCKLKDVVLVIANIPILEELLSLEQNPKEFTWTGYK